MSTNKEATEREIQLVEAALKAAAELCDPPAAADFWEWHHIEEAINSLDPAAIVASVPVDKESAITEQAPPLPEPAGKLHDDGYFTWNTTAPHKANYAGWRTGFYTADQLHERDAMWMARIAALRSEQAPAVGDEIVGQQVWLTEGGELMQRDLMRKEVYLDPSGQAPPAKVVTEGGKRDYETENRMTLAVLRVLNNRLGAGVATPVLAGECVDAVLASTPPAVPPGHVIVPVEPTKDMLDAAEKIDWGDADVRGNCCNQWNAMLSAAPAAQQGEQQ